MQIEVNDKSLNNERKVARILVAFMDLINKQYNCTPNNRISNKTGAPTKSRKYNSCYKSWLACCDSWNSFFSSSFGREKMGSNFNSSISINGNSGTAPYSIVRLITLQDIFGIGGFTLLTTLLSTLALLYWCNPKHRRSIRL